MNYQVLFDFEQALCEYTGAPYAVVTDGATHAIELCMRYDAVRQCEITPWTYISIPMMLHHLAISFRYLDEDQQTWIGEYQFQGTRIWDSARRLQRNMYRSGSMQCLSFGNGKPLQLGRVGAILLDDQNAYESISKLRSDGRDLRISPWIQQQQFPLGFHYFPTLESCARGLELLPTVDQDTKFVAYNDCRKITIS